MRYEKLTSHIPQSMHSLAHLYMQTWREYDLFAWSLVFSVSPLSDSCLVIVVADATSRNPLENAKQVIGDTLGKAVNFLGNKLFGQDRQPPTGPSILDIALNVY